VDEEGDIYISDAESKAIYKIAPDGKRILSIPFPDKCLFNAQISVGRDGTLYVPVANDCSGGGGAVYALDTEDGKEIWRFEIEKGTLSSAIAIDRKGNLYIVDGNGNIYCLKPDGSVLWKYSLRESLGEKTADIFGSSPVISNNSIFIVSQDGTLLSIGSP
jgi:outer membrane protein assembly factor BamB